MIFAFINVFLFYLILLYFLVSIFWKPKSINPKKVLVTTFLRIFKISLVMVTNTFFANSRTHFYKMDIFKNVQNENLKMNLEIPNFQKYLFEICILLVYALK
jgi:hypothetical protein